MVDSSCLENAVMLSGEEPVGVCKLNQTHFIYKSQISCVGQVVRERRTVVSNYSLG